MSQKTEPKKGEKFRPAVAVGVERMTAKHYKNYLRDCVLRFENNEPQSEKGDCLACIYQTINEKYGTSRAGKSYIPMGVQVELRDWAMESTGVMKDALIDVMFYLKIDDIHEAIRKRWSNGVFEVDPDTGESIAEGMIENIKMIFVGRLDNPSAHHLSVSDLIDKSIIDFAKKMRKKVKPAEDKIKPVRSYTGSEKMKEFRWEKLRRLFGNFNIESREELYKFLELGLNAFKQELLDSGKERDWNIFEQRVVNPPEKQTLEKIAAGADVVGERVRQISVMMTREFVWFLVENSTELIGQLEAKQEELV